MKNRFKERQKFTKFWFWIILVLVSGIFIWGFVQQVILGIPWGSNPLPNLGLSLFLLIPAGIFLFFYYCRLTTIINEEGISIRFIPFFFKMKKFYWKDIEELYVRKYNAISEFGGYGIRQKKGIAYTIKGEKGIQLILRDGKKILIGTQRPKEIQSFFKENQGLSII